MDVIQNMSYIMLEKTSMALKINGKRKKKKTLSRVALKSLINPSTNMNKNMLFTLNYH